MGWAARLVHTSLGNTSDAEGSAGFSGGRLDIETCPSSNAQNPQEAWQSQPSSAATCVMSRSKNSGP
jgi:hypothetical protein